MHSDESKLVPVDQPAVIRLPATIMARKRAYLKAANGQPLAEWIWSTLDTKAGFVFMQITRTDTRRTFRIPAHIVAELRATRYARKGSDEHYAEYMRTLEDLLLLETWLRNELNWREEDFAAHVVKCVG